MYVICRWGITACYMVNYIMVSLRRIFSDLSISQVNDPETILALAQNISAFNVSSSEGRNALESVVMAACAAGVPDTATKYIAQFSPAVDPAQSSRLAVLHGMILEAQGDHRAAAAAYDAIVAANPAHAVCDSAALMLRMPHPCDCTIRLPAHCALLALLQLAKKRLIACAMARGDARGAAEQLNSFLKVFPSDTEAWTTLAELHEADSSWEYARFCYEECAMISPTTPYFHVKAAETMLLEHGTPPSRRTVSDRSPRTAPPMLTHATHMPAAFSHAHHRIFLRGAESWKAPETMLHMLCTCQAALTHVPAGYCAWCVCCGRRAMPWVRLALCHWLLLPYAHTHACASTPPQACAACTLASSTDVKCVAPAAIMRSIANGKLPSGTSFVQQTGHSGASSQFGDFDVALDAAAVAAHADDNAALLVAAMQGLRDMYADAAFQPSAEVAAAAQRDPVNNSDGIYAVGSWTEAADSLALIASVALAGASK